MPSLLALPPELLIEVYTYLSYPSICAMELTHPVLHRTASRYKQYLNRTTPPREMYTLLVRPRVSKIRTQPYTMDDLLEIETWPCHGGAGPGARLRLRPRPRPQAGTGTGTGTGTVVGGCWDGKEYFACHICMRIRGAGQFSNASMTKERGKMKVKSMAERDREGKGIRGRPVDYHHTRICIDCGVRIGAYKPGCYMMYGGPWAVETGNGNGNGNGIGNGETRTKKGRYGIVCLRCCKFKRVDGLGVEWEERVCLDCSQQEIKE